MRRFVVPVCVNLFIFTVKSMVVTPEFSLMMFVSKTIDILFFFSSLFPSSSSFLSKKRHLVAISCERLYVCFNALSHLFVLLLDFSFFSSSSLSPACRFSFFLHRWIITMHIHRKTLLFLFAGIKVSLIVHQQCAHVCLLQRQ